MKQKACEQEGNSTKKPDGGYFPLSVLQICMVWFARKRHLITALDQRVYFALCELKSRRCTLKPGESPYYTIQELERLVGWGRGPFPLRASQSRLQKAGLLATSKKSEITLTTTPESMPLDDLSGLHHMLGQIKNPNRKIPVPRRIIRLIASGARPSVIATIFGHLIRCMYFKNGGCNPKGTCKVSWIAELFNISPRSVKSARKHLTEELGWLEPLSTEQWYLNRYGLRVNINLYWNGAVSNDTPKIAPPSVDNSPHEQATGPEKEPKISPPQAEKEPKISPPSNIDQKPLQDLKNQKPERHPFGEPACGGNGFCAKTSKTRPTLNKVLSSDLRDMNRLLSLYEQALAKGMAEKSDRGRLNFVAAAEHARSIGSINPPGLFAWMVRKQQWNYITNDDEDSATRRLKTHLYGNFTETRGTIPWDGLKPERLELSEDARIIAAVKRALQQHQMQIDPFFAIRREKPEFTRERYKAAEDELRNHALRQKQQNTPEDMSSELAHVREALPA